MGKRYKVTRAPTYGRKPINHSIPLTRFTIAQKLEQLPDNVQNAIRKMKGKLVYTTECAKCGEKSLLIFDTGDGEWIVCGNPECTTYGDAEWYPKRGGA